MQVTKLLLNAVPRVHSEYQFQLIATQVLAQTQAPTHALWVPEACTTVNVRTDAAQEKQRSANGGALHSKLSTQDPLHEKLHRPLADQDQHPPSGINFREQSR